MVAKIKNLILAHFDLIVWVLRNGVEDTLLLTNFIE